MSTPTFDAKGWDKKLRAEEYTTPMQAISPIPNAYQELEQTQRALGKASKRARDLPDDLVAQGQKASMEAALAGSKQNLMRKISLISPGVTPQRINNAPAMSSGEFKELINRHLEDDVTKSIYIDPISGNFQKDVKALLGLTGYSPYALTSMHDQIRGKIGAIDFYKNLINIGDITNDIAKQISMTQLNLSMERMGLADSRRQRFRNAWAPVYDKIYSGKAGLQRAKEDYGNEWEIQQERQIAEGIKNDPDTYMQPMFDAVDGKLQGSDPLGQLDIGMTLHDAYNPAKENAIGLIERNNQMRQSLDLDRSVLEAIVQMPATP